MSHSVVAAPESDGAEGPRDRARSLRGPLRAEWTFPLVVGVVSAVVFAFVRTHLIDDTYITLSYARNLAFDGHWGLTLEQTSNTATSPLNVLLLAAITLVVRDAVVAAGVLFVLCQVGLALGLRRWGRERGLGPAFAPLAVVTLLVNPLLVSSVGLEMALGASILVWLAVFTGERRYWAAGAMVGLLAVTRLDLLVVAAVVLVVRRRFRGGVWHMAASAAAVALPWFLFSWFVLGSAVPDTLVIKTLQESWGEHDFGNGLALYFREYPAATVLSVWAVVAAVGSAVVWAIGLRRGARLARVSAPMAVFALGGAAHALAYVWLGVPPYHWYYAPSVVAATVFVAALCSRWWFTAAIPVLAAAVSVALYGASGLPRDEAPVHSNHVASPQYLRIGEELRDIVGDGAVRSAGEIGALAYSCECAIVDVFSDRGRMAEAIEEKKQESSALGVTLLEANFAFLDAPAEPVRTEYELRITTKQAPAEAIAVWRTTSAWGSGHRTLYLVEAD